jgi:hypothetical protein
MRADRFGDDWQRLHRQRDQAFQSGRYSRAEAVTSRMGAMAKGLERDAQVDSLMRNRRIERGLHTRGAGSIGRELTEYRGLERGRGLDMGTHINCNYHRTQNACLRGLARHQKGRRQFLDKSWSRMVAPRRQGTVADPLGHSDERPDRPSPAAAEAVKPPYWLLPEKRFG